MRQISYAMRFTGQATPVGTAGTVLRAATLTATDRALVPAGTALAYRNAGGDPLVLLLVTISPADQ